MQKNFNNNQLALWLKNEKVDELEYVLIRFKNKIPFNIIARSKLRGNEAADDLKDIPELLQSNVKVMAYKKLPSKNFTIITIRFI